LICCLQTRKYSEKKIQENVECEIMHVILEEALDSYSSDIVVTMSSDTVDEMEENVNHIADWMAEWIAQTTS
jgi:broad-specificity NMP kinase